MLPVSVSTTRSNPLYPKPVIAAYPNHNGSARRTSSQTAAIEQKPAAMAALQPPKLCVVSPPTLLTDLKPDQCNPALSATEQAHILRLRNAIEAGPSYNTFNDILEICRRAKVLRDEGIEDSFAKSWAMGPAALLRGPNHAYKGGNCFASAEVLKGSIEQKLGLKAYVVGYYAGRNTVAQWPSLTSDGEEENRQLLDLLGHINHMDVAVPHRSAQDMPLRVLHITCGLGSSPHYWQELCAGVDDDRIAMLRLVPRPDIVRWRALWGSHRFYISDRSQNHVFGVKLFEGEAFVSLKAAESLTAGRTTTPHLFVDTEGEITRSFNFGALCRRQAMLDTDDQDEVNELAEEWQNCRTFLNVVADLFGQPKPFAAEVEDLLRHHREILRHIVLEPALTVSSCMPALRGALDVGGPLEYLVALWGLEDSGRQLRRARRFMEEAAKKVRCGQEFVARMAYNDAQEAYIKAVEETAGVAEARCAQLGIHLPPLDPYQVGTMPVVLYRAIARGLVAFDSSLRAYGQILGPVHTASKHRIESDLNIVPSR